MIEAPWCMGYSCPQLGAYSVSSDMCTHLKSMKAGDVRDQVLCFSFCLVWLLAERCPEMHLGKLNLSPLWQEYSHK